mmetsp:Transcript_43683/g.51163  ORF Transcript_43683/g.51163 Transcript_43683/m.51163 type:complete len:612 (+) Transcript_43683:706-2541(+)
MSFSEFDDLSEIDTKDCNESFGITNTNAEKEANIQNVSDGIHVYCVVSGNNVKSIEENNICVDQLHSFKNQVNSSPKSVLTPSLSAAAPSRRKEIVESKGEDACRARGREEGRRSAMEIASNQSSSSRFVSVLSSSQGVETASVSNVSDGAKLPHYINQNDKRHKISQDKCTSNENDNGNCKQNTSPVNSNTEEKVLPNVKSKKQNALSNRTFGNYFTRTLEKLRSLNCTTNLSVADYITDIPIDLFENESVTSSERPCPHREDSTDLLFRINYWMNTFDEEDDNTIDNDVKVNTENNRGKSVIEQINQSAGKIKTPVSESDDHYSEEGKKRIDEEPEKQRKKVQFEYPMISSYKIQERLKSSELPALFYTKDELDQFYYTDSDDENDCEWKENTTLIVTVDDEETSFCDIKQNMNEDATNNVGIKKMNNPVQVQEHVVDSNTTSKEINTTADTSFSSSASTLSTASDSQISDILSRKKMGVSSLMCQCVNSGDERRVKVAQSEVRTSSFQVKLKNLRLRTKSQRCNAVRHLLSWNVGKSKASHGELRGPILRDNENRDNFNLTISVATITKKSSKISDHLGKSETLPNSVLLGPMKTNFNDEQNGNMVEI